MPLKPGYSRDVIAENIAELAKTIPQNQARAAALAYARVSYFKRFPQGALPPWLPLPKKYLMRHHYDKLGNPLHAEAAATLSEKPKGNPAQRTARAELRAAARLGESFSGHKYNRLLKLRRKPATGPRVAIGPVSGIMYFAKRDGRTEQYLHRFAEKSRPLLVATSDGTRLELLGGAFRFTDRGIVDLPVTVKRKR